MIEGITFNPQHIVSNNVTLPQNTTGTDISKQFSELLHAAMDQTTEQKAVTDQLTTQFITGDLNDIHNLMIETEKAAIGLELTVQVRNKVIEAYQEIMRMQI